MMKKLTGLSRDRYALRRIALDQIDSTIREREMFGQKVPTKLRRIYNIVNQSDPDDLFGHMSEKTLRKYVLGEKPLPKYLTGRGKSGLPDDALFKDLRLFFNQEIHHKNPLAQNKNAINPNWKDNDLFIFHQTLREAQTGAGSTRLGLMGLLQDEHTGKVSVHTDAGGTVVEPFAPLTQTDPELAAGEFILNNFQNSEIAEWWQNKRNSKTKQVLDAPEGSPLREALIESRGNRAKFESRLRAMGSPAVNVAAEVAPYVVDPDVGIQLGKGDFGGAAQQVAQNIGDELQYMAQDPYGAFKDIRNTAALATVNPRAAAAYGTLAMINGGVHFVKGISAGRAGFDTVERYDQYVTDVEEVKKRRSGVDQPETDDPNLFQQAADFIFRGL